MLEFGDSIYYFDLNALDKAITLTDGNETVTETEQKTTFHEAEEPVMVEVFEKTLRVGKEINAVKYDLLKSFIEYIMDYDEVQDTTLGAQKALDETPLGYKIVFNTLLREKIIKEES